MTASQLNTQENFDMRCLACNIELTDYEATRKDQHDEFIDLCNSCYKAAEYDDKEVSVRLDLVGEADILYESEEDYLQDDKFMLKY
jgi:hypothetical protein